MLPVAILRTIRFVVSKNAVQSLLINDEFAMAFVVMMFVVLLYIVIFLG